MRGHIYRRGSTWTIVHDETTPGGTRKQRSRGGFKTEKEAQRELTKALATLDAGTYVKPTVQTVGDYLREWLAAVELQLRPSTFTSYKSLVERQIVPRIGSVPLQKLTAPQLNAMYAAMLKKGRLTGKGGALSPRTVRYCHTVIRKALRDAVGWGLLGRNVADSAQPPKKSTTSKPTWSTEQLRAFLDGVADDRLFAAYLLLATTGLRRGEVLGLKWSDLDGSKLAIRRSLVNVENVPTFSEPKTSKGRRVVALDPTTVRALRSHEERQLLDRVTLGDAWGNRDDLIFVDEVGNPIHPATFSQAFARHVARLKLPKLSLHGLRHTHATLALRAGVHPKVVSERLGHASVAFTLDVYTDALPDLQETAALLVADLVLGNSR